MQLDNKQIFWLVHEDALGLRKKLVPSSRCSSAIEHTLLKQDAMGLKPTRCLDFFFSSLSGINSASLIQVLHGGATLLIFPLKLS